MVRRRVVSCCGVIWKIKHNDVEPYVAVVTVTADLDATFFVDFINVTRSLTLSIVFLFSFFVIDGLLLSMDCYV